jgi:hypothetical protein
MLVQLLKEKSAMNFLKHGEAFYFWLGFNRKIKRTNKIGQHTCLNTFSINRIAINRSYIKSDASGDINAYFF